MKERPILFSGPMVRALLAGKKTQTRRIVKPPRHVDPTHWTISAGEPTHWPADEAKKFELTCPYGQPGDRLWVRETWAPFNVWAHPPDNVTHTAHIRYAAGGPDFNPLITTEQRQQVKRWGEPGKDVWVPSIHMFRWASRLTLEVMEVRVQRIQEISEDDARAEGVEPYGEAPTRYRNECGDPRGPYALAFAELWDSINGKRADWDSNPWVWAVNFKVLSDAAAMEAS